MQIRTLSKGVVGNLLQIILKGDTLQILASCKQANPHVGHRHRNGDLLQTVALLEGPRPYLQHRSRNHHSSDIALRERLSINLHHHVGQ